MRPPTRRCDGIDEHWQARAVAAVRQYRATNPQGWSEYLAEAAEMGYAVAPITDGWDDGRHEIEELNQVRRILAQILFV